MEEYFDPRIYIAGELGIGLNSCSNCLGNCYIEDESAYGTFHVGLGRNIALGGVQNAKGHFDLVCRNPIFLPITVRLWTGKDYCTRACVILKDRTRRQKLRDKRRKDDESFINRI